MSYHPEVTCIPNQKIWCGINRFGYFSNDISVREVTYIPNQKIWRGINRAAFYSKDLSVGEIIFKEMQRHPKLVAQISDTENTVLTREELHYNSMRVASYLRNLGLKQTDIVGIIARNTTHIFAVVYACFFNGIAFHSLNINYDQETIEKLYDITKPQIIFCDGDEFEKVKAATINLNVRIVTMRNHKSDSISIDQLLSTPIEHNFSPARLEQGNDQTLAILCTSGTTGIPKAATYPNTHHIVDFCSFLTISDVMYTHSNLDWLSGLTTTVASGVHSSLRIISDNTFDPTAFLRLIEKHKVTWLQQGPSHMAQLVNCPEFENANLDSIQYYIYGGSNCSLKIQQAIHRRLQIQSKFVFSYTMTELGGVGTANLNFEEKPNSVGRPMAGTQLKILNEQNEPLGPNEMGEICMFNGQHWSGYYGNPEETHKMRDKDLWYHTGDLGYMDEDGFLFILDRKKDMLKYQNIMYYPHEIEQIISQMPGVAEVCVFGILNPLVGDEAAAAVVKKHGAQLNAQDVVEYVEKHVAAKYKQLNGGAFIVEDLKRSANHKTNRRETKSFCLDMAKK